MAQRVQILLEDDTDKSVADETVAFALDGVNYEIDLSSSNAARLRDDLSHWVGHARPTGGRRVSGRRRAGGSSATKRANVSAVREWARAQGMPVSDRGRVPGSVQDAYDKAHA
ncbi:MAG: histone-like nucleoid-structuring protein Lsr2 [Dermatophilaceae bacterium]